MLGGAAVALPLPALEAMLGTNGEALAGGTPLPTRFGVWFWGNGVKPEAWIPSSTGAGWAVPELLQPLSAHREYISPITGFEIKTDTYPHHSGMAGVMTGMRYHQLGSATDTIVSTFAGPSVDQIAADHIGGFTPFRSLEVGITWFRGSSEGSTYEHLSHNGPNNWNACEYDAATFYDRLFTVSGPQRTFGRRRVLDAVREQANALSRRLGLADQARLDQYLTSVDQLDVRLAVDPQECPAMERPGSYLDVDGKEQIEEKNAIFAEMLALALACDLTRVFSVQFSTAGSAVIMGPVGATDGLHRISHDEASPQPTMHAAVEFTMEQLAVFLRTLRDTQEGDGNLLDRSSILCTSEVCDGKAHTNTDFPLLLAGGGGGRLKAGLHHRDEGGRNVSDAVLTALHGAGVPVESFGAEEGLSTDPVDELLA